MQEKVLLAHGGGGLLSREFIEHRIVSRFGNVHLDALDDSAVLAVDQGRLAFTTDSYVVNPLFFPGGNIGDLAVCGTVNDLAMAGARPMYISLALILEEGFSLQDLDRILDTVKTRAVQAGVEIVCGDTKVVGKGQADGLYLNTAGVGLVADGVDIASRNARPGDRVLLSGPVGLHGLAVLLGRGAFGLSSALESDVAPLHAVVQALLDAGVVVRSLRDPTRGGLAAALDEIARRSGVAIEIHEADIPTRPEQVSACEILGLDPLHIASEGCFTAVVEASHAERALKIMRRFAEAQSAAEIGEVLPRGNYPLFLRTAIGSRRLVTVPRGEEMPRIC
ncbi:MAG: hydrogenase expression/formation protein HypE [Planctomycetota bacterium]